MLVLSRRVGEKIAIGTDIIITIADVQGGKVKVGIQAPRDVEILRLPEHSELFEESLAAAQK